MIVCILDGKIGYPSTTDKIKVTFENQYVKDSGSYTYDISFPMSIDANRLLFKNVQRLDVKKTLPAFEECRLLADNRVIMSGKGTVTAITNETVKVQIVGGKSRIKYNSKFEKHFIDEIDYPDVVLDSGINKEIYQKAGVGFPNMGKQNWMIFIDLTTSNFVGQTDVAVLSPVSDETNEIIANRVSVTKFDKIKVNGVKFPKGTYSYMTNCAVQPYLLYILGKVMEYEGYNIRRNDLDKAPWNRLVIVSACKSGKIRNALPHWTVYKFLEELRKFFNASFLFDEEDSSVSIIATNEMLSNDMATYECEDDFSVEYDEDGLDSISTSNIEYSFDDAANRDWREYISQSVQKNYKTMEYDSIDSMVAAAEAMTEKERRTIIFKCGYNYYIWAELPKDGNPESKETEVVRTQCGFFNPVIRDMNSDTFQELNICPAAMCQMRNNAYKRGSWEEIFDKMENPFLVIPSVTNEKELGLEDMTVDEDGEYYYTVQDAMEGSSEDTSSSETEDDSKLPVAFQAENVLNLHAHKAVKYSDRVVEDEDTKYRVPVLYTDYRMYPEIRVSSERASLALESLPYYAYGGFGGGARNSVKGRFDSSSLDKHNQIVIKLVTDDIPDPSKIYVIRNKKYICEKIEMEVTNDGISKVKTGYFYEII